jgi:hypothetical protein
MDFLELATQNIIPREFIPTDTTVWSVERTRNQTSLTRTHEQLESVIVENPVPGTTEKKQLLTQAVALFQSMETIDDARRLKVLLDIYATTDEAGIIHSSYEERFGLSKTHTITTDQPSYTSWSLTERTAFDPIETNGSIRDSGFRTFSHSVSLIEQGIGQTQGEPHGVYIDTITSSQSGSLQTNIRLSDDGTCHGVFFSQPGRNGRRGEYRYTDTGWEKKLMAAEQGNRTPDVTAEEWMMIRETIGFDPREVRVDIPASKKAFMDASTRPLTQMDQHIRPITESFLQFTPIASPRLAALGA